MYSLEDFPKLEFPGVLWCKDWQPIADLWLLRSSFISIFDESQAGRTLHCILKNEDLVSAHEYAEIVLNRFNVVSAIVIVVMWNTFKRETQQDAKDCSGEHPRSMSGPASRETLENIEGSCFPLLARNWYRFMALSRRTRALLRRHKGGHPVRSLAEEVAEEVEGHSNVNDLWFVYRTLKKFRSKLLSLVNAIQAADLHRGRQRWAEGWLG